MHLYFVELKEFRRVFLMSLTISLSPLKIRALVEARLLPNPYAPNGLDPPPPRKNVALYRLWRLLRIAKLSSIADCNRPGTPVVRPFGLANWSPLARESTTVRVENQTLTISGQRKFQQQEAGKGYGPGHCDRGCRAGA